MPDELIPLRRPEEARGGQSSMYQSNSIQIDGADDVVAVITEPGYVAVQLHPPTGGGSVSLMFAGVDGPTDGIAAVDKLIAALYECRVSLLKRMHGQMPRPTLVAHGDPVAAVKVGVRDGATEIEKQAGRRALASLQAAAGHAGVPYYDADTQTGRCLSCGGDPFHEFIDGSSPDFPASDDR